MTALLNALGESITSMLFVLCVACGLLAAYWDGAYCKRRGWERDARYTRIVGWSVAIAGSSLYLVAAIGRMIVR